MKRDIFFILISAGLLSVYPCMASLPEFTEREGNKKIQGDSVLYMTGDSLSLWRFGLKSDTSVLYPATTFNKHNFPQGKNGYYLDSIPQWVKDTLSPEKLLLVKKLNAHYPMKFSLRPKGDTITKYELTPKSVEEFLKLKIQGHFSK